jgi:hypothetical protein
MKSEDNSKESSNSKKQELFGKALFDVEHALGMYATSFCTLPAEGIYDIEALAPLMSVIESCHIYIIGFLPVVELVDAQQSGQQMSLVFSLLGNKYNLEADIPDELTLKQEGGVFYLQNNSGEKFWPDESLIMQQLSHLTNAVNFEVKYIGQAYGKDSSRNAIDRLLKHETLQKISLKGVPAGYRLCLLLLEVQPNNQLFTVFNPFAQNKDAGPERIKSGLDKLYGTTEQERIALYEASLIRYFSPTYNKEFKNSFPSTNLKILRDCYDKDFSAVIAEICIDELPFRLFSEAVEASNHHIAKHDLHDDAARKAFLSV